MAKSTLQREIGKKHPFGCVEQEATLNLIRSADHVGREAQALFESHGISSPQYNVLRILRGHRDTGLSGQQIVAEMVTQTPDITRLVDRLEAAGHVRRERTPRDRRLVLVHATPQALELLERLDSPVLELHRRQLGHLSRAELAELNRLLVKVRRPPAASDRKQPESTGADGRPANVGSTGSARRGRPAGKNPARRS